MSTTMDRTITVNATTITCCHAGCGLSFAVPAWWETERRRLHDGWYCPNGHQQYFGGETDAERRIRELEEERKQLRREAEEIAADYRLERNAREQVQRSLAATKGVLTKTRKRIAAGVCPCCHRTVQQLARHMETKHPDYAPTPTACAPNERGE